MSKKDYYKVLGVEKNASKDDIKRAYKKLAKQFHPDLNKEADASEKFKEINEAAGVLGDDEKRAQYDQYGTTADQFHGGFNGQDFSDFMSSFRSEGFDFENIFDSFFSGFGGRRRSSDKRGSDLRYDMEIELEEAAKGVTKSIIIPRNERCSRCNGTGAESPSDLISCDTCNGTGMHVRNMRTPFGIMQTRAPCGKCRGLGKFIKKECPICDGAGRVEKERKLEVKIPAGAEDGMRLRITGEGEAGERGGSTGDLYIVLHIAEHDRFKRDGSDLLIDMAISFTQAALGAEIEVPTLEGKAKLKIPPGTQTGTVFRMRGKGLPSVRGYETGDENVRVIVHVPEKLTKDQRELLEKLEKTFEKKGWF